SSIHLEKQSCPPRRSSDLSRAITTTRRSSPDSRFSDGMLTLHTAHQGAKKYTRVLLCAEGHCRVPVPAGTAGSVSAGAGSPLFRDRKSTRLNSSHVKNSYA